MQLRQRKEANILLVEPAENRLDARVAVEFKERMDTLIDGGEHKLLLNLSGVEFVDSSGLGAMVSVLKHISPVGRIALCCVQPAIQELFQLTRMNKVFTLYDSETEGLKALSD